MERNSPCYLRPPLPRQGTPETGLNTQTCLYTWDSTIVLGTMGILKVFSSLESGGCRGERILEGKPLKVGQNFFGVFTQGGGY